MSRKSVKESLLLQLQIKGADVDHFTDLVSDYMALWDIKNKLIKDIKDRGVMYKDYSSVGVEMQKNNPSTKELIAVSRQMLAILKDMAITTDGAKAGDEDEEM